jgi:predicted ATPase
MMLNGAHLRQATGTAGVQKQTGLTPLAAGGASQALAGAGACSQRARSSIALKSPASDAAKAEALFELALAVARQQQAKSWELRAAMSMARLWRSQGKPEEARNLLTPGYGWFTEGFDTLDLK